MARRPTFPPKITRHASGNARVRWRGVDYYLGPFGSEQADRAYTELLPKLAAQKRGEKLTPANEKLTREPTVAEVVARWWTEEAPRYDPLGREPDQFRRALEPLLRLHGNDRAADFDAAALEQLRKAMASGSWMSVEEKARAPRAWCRNVINRHMVRIGTVWRWAERRKLVPPGSYANLKTVPGLAMNDRTVRHTARSREATFAEVKAVARQASPPIAAALLLMWWTGMRSGEVRLMRASEIDTGGDVWTYRPTRHKNAWRGQLREVMLGAKCQAIVRPWLSRASGKDAYLFAPPWRRDTRAVYTCEAFAAAVRRAAELAGLPGWHAYQLRHAAKTRLTRAVGLDGARALLGHASAETTLRYGERDRAAAVDAARKTG